MADKRNPVIVIGGMNVDIIGTPYKRLLSKDSNPGTITHNCGGVGRNIAETMARLGHEVHMVTALGDDANVYTLQDNCRKLNIGLDHSLVVPGGRCSTYLCLNDEKGEMVGAISDMAVLDALTPAFMASQLDWLNTAALVVLDANLPEETLIWLADHLTVPLFADPVSVNKAGRLKKVLSHLTMIKPNLHEARLLSGVPILDDHALPEAAGVLLNAGTKIVAISLGPDGVYYDNGTDRGIVPCFTGTIVDTTGCGDAFTAAAASAYLDGVDMISIIRQGVAASALTATAAGAVSPRMSRELLKTIIENKKVTK